MEYLHCILNTPGLVVHYDPANKCLVNVWLGPHTPESVRHHGQLIYSCLLAHPCAKILSDHRALRGNWERAAAWVGQHLLHKFAARGVQFLAWVPAAHAPADHHAMKQVRRADCGLTVSIWATAELAAGWLDRQRVVAPRLWLQ